MTHDVSAISSSPSFVRQEIVAAPNDWAIWKGSSNVSTIMTHDGHSIQVPNAKNISQCKIGDPSIESVSYISTGKALNATVWLNSNFEEPPLKDTLDLYPKQLEIKVSNLTKIFSHMTVDKYATIKIADELLNPSKNVTIDEQPNPTTIAGNSAYKVVYSARNSEGIDLKNMTLWTIKNSKVYNITYSALQANYSDYLPVIQNIINSFQFEDSADSSKSAKQLVHSNGNITQFRGLGINLNYPIGWKKQEEKTVDNISRGIILRSPFQDEGLRTPSWHDITFTMAIAIGSVQHPAVTDYRVILSRNLINNTGGWEWTSRVVEVSAYDKERVLEEGNNYRVLPQQDKPYILFSFDLGKINFPQQYNAVFYITDSFVKEHRFCRLVDITNWVSIPPPEFVMSTTPNSIVLRPGGEKDSELTIKGNTNLPSEAFLTDSNKNNNSENRDVSLSLSPNKVYIPPSSVGTSTLHVNVSANAKPTSYTFPIVANISLPNTITNRGGEIFSNSKSESLSQRSNLTLTVLPPYTAGELLSSFVNTWITPITGLWTFLAGVGAVIAPLAISIYRKRTKKLNETKKSAV